jgi:hypothetical protein
MPGTGQATGTGGLRSTTVPNDRELWPVRYLLRLQQPQRNEGNPQFAPTMSGPTGAVVVIQASFRDVAATCAQRSISSPRAAGATCHPIS